MKKREKEYTFQIIYKGSNGKFLEHFLVFFFIASSSICSMWTFLSGMKIEFDMPSLFAAVILFSIWIYPAFSRERAAKITLPLTLIIFLVLLYYFRAAIQNGAACIGNDLVNPINYYYGANIPLFNISEKDSVMTYLYFSAFLITCIWSFFILFRRRKAVVFFILLWTLSPLLVGLFPSFASLSCLLLLLPGVLAYCGGRKRHRMKGKSFAAYQKDISLKAGSVMVLWSVIILACAWFIAAPFIKNFDDYAGRINESVRSFDFQGWWENTPLLSNIEYPLSRGDNARGGVGRGELGGTSNFIRSKLTALEVTVSERPKETIYLKGYVGGTYTQNRWEEVDPSYVDEFYMAYFQDEGHSLSEEEIESIKRILIAGPMITNYDTEAAYDSLLIKNIRANTDYLYLPGNALVPDWANVYGEAYVLGIDEEEYQIEYLSDNYALATNQQSVEAWKEAASPAIVFWYIDFLREYYLKLPDSGLERLTAVCDSWQSLSNGQKVDNVISYLNQNAVYNLSVGKTPEGEEFTDYFLFEKKEGYCVHFATAAALMLRELDIPTKYVSGYIVTPNMFVKNKDGSYTAQVTEEKAHAWVEVFADGLWYVVEATPGYASAAADASAAEETTADTKETKVQETAKQTEPVPDETEKEIDDTKVTDASIDQSGSQSEEKSPVSSSADTIWSNFKTILEWTGIVAGSAALLYAMLWLQKVVRKKVRLKGIRKQSPREEIRHIFYVLFDMLVFDGVPKDIDCMSKEFISEMCLRLQDSSEEEIKVFVDLVYTAAFGNELLTEADVQRAHGYYKALHRRLLLMYPLWKKFIFIYVKAY